MEYKDYYRVLAVSRDATHDEIKRAYRKLARKYHPDVSKEKDAEEQFKRVGEAYEVLKDPEKRAAYDQFGSNWKEGQGFKPPPDWDAGFEFSGGGQTGYSDFFETLFGQRGFNTGRHDVFHAQGQDHHARIVISLKDAYRGATQSITLKMAELDKEGHLKSCTRTLNVKIPKGILEGQHIRLTGQGGAGMGQGKRGDLYLDVRFKADRLFRAEGRDIIIDLPVTPWEAALGGTVKVPTLGGIVTLKVPANAESGQKLRLKARGLPGVPLGDQYCLLRIVAPPAVTEADQALYRTMAEQMPMNPRAEMGV